jgi:hypothetical protein
MVNPTLLVLEKSIRQTDKIIKKIPPSPKTETAFRKGVKKPPALFAKPCMAFKMELSKP